MASTDILSANVQNMLQLRRFISDIANRAKFGGLRHALSVDSLTLPSLFVVSLPRSFSSYSYLLTRAALRLREPEFTTFGEILNCGRFHRGDAPSGAVPQRYFIRQEQDQEGFRRATTLLGRIVEVRGFAYKDVVQPFAVAAWLHGRREFRILHIRRNLADVAMAMLELKWLYPAGAASPTTIEPMLAGLVLADNALAQLPAVRIEYDDIVRDGTALSAALSRLYPKHEFPSIRFHNPRYGVECAKTMSRRNSPDYREIERRIAELATNLSSRGMRDTFNSPAADFQPSKCFIPSP